MLMMSTLFVGNQEVGNVFQFLCEDEDSISLAFARALSNSSSSLLLAFSKRIPNLTIDTADVQILMSTEQDMVPITSVTKARL